MVSGNWAAPSIVVPVSGLLNLPGLITTRSVDDRFANKICELMNFAEPLSVCPRNHMGARSNDESHWFVSDSVTRC